MLDIYHSGHFYLRGGIEEHGLAEIRARSYSSWPKEDLTALRLTLSDSTYLPSPGDDSLRFFTEGASAGLRFATSQPWDDESRAVWGPLCGHVVDELLVDLRIDSWVLTSDEEHVVGYWHRSGPDGPVGVVNSVVGRETYSLRPELSYMLMDRFGAAGIDYELADLGDLPRGISTAGE